MSMSSQTRIDDPLKESTWVGILNASQVQRADQILADISRTLVDRCDKHQFDEVSLASGLSGVSIFFDHVAAKYPDRELSQLSDELLNHAIERLGQQLSGPSLFSGFSGVAWAANYLNRTDIDCSTVSETLLSVVTDGDWNRPYDLVSGIVGIGVYALESFPSVEAESILEFTVDHLEQTAERRGKGATWKTESRWIPLRQQKRFPAGHYNLGLAHGVAGIIAYLARIYRAGIARQRVLRLLEQAITWLIQQRLDPRLDGWFGNITAENQPARTAWCYGDPGIAAALILAGRCTGREDWQATGIQVARCAANRTFRQSQVCDTGLCHGSAGLGHVFNRLYQCTGDQELLAAARMWFEVTLTLQQPSEDNSLTNDQSVGILEGSAGVGLALLAASSPSEPGWDRMLLLSS